MNKIIFLVEEAPKAAIQRALSGEAIFTAAEREEELQEMLRDAAACHFDEATAPKIIACTLYQKKSSPLEAPARSERD